MSCWMLAHYVTHILTVLATELEASDGCDTWRTIEEVPPFTTEESIESAGWTPGLSDRIRSAYELDFADPVRWYCRLAIQWQRQGRQWTDHLSGLAIDWDEKGSLAPTRVAHRIHGLPFCSGFLVERPRKVGEWCEEACNASVELRMTKYCREGVLGAAIIDFLERWTPFVETFPSGCRQAGGHFASLALELGESG